MKRFKKKKRENIFKLSGVLTFKLYKSVKLLLT